MEKTCRVNGIVYELVQTNKECTECVAKKNDGLCQKLAACGGFDSFYDYCWKKVEKHSDTKHKKK